MASNTLNKAYVRRYKHKFCEDEEGFVYHTRKIQSDDDHELKQTQSLRTISTDEKSEEIGHTRTFTIQRSSIDIHDLTSRKLEKECKRIIFIKVLIRRLSDVNSSKETFHCRLRYDLTWLATKQENKEYIKLSAKNKWKPNWIPKINWINAVKSNTHPADEQGYHIKKSILSPGFEDTMIYNTDELSVSDISFAESWNDIVYKINPLTNKKYDFLGFNPLRGKWIHCRYEADITFAEEFELQAFPFDCQDLTLYFNIDGPTRYECHLLPFPSRHEIILFDPMFSAISGWEINNILCEFLTTKHKSELLKSNIELINQDTLKKQTSTKLKDKLIKSNELNQSENILLLPPTTVKTKSETKLDIENELLTDKDNEHKLKTYDTLSSVENEFSLVMIHIKTMRKWHGYIADMLVIMCLFISAGNAISIDITTLFHRLQYCVTLLLAMVAAIHFIQNHYPEIPYLTFMDKYILAGFCFIFCIMLWSASTNDTTTEADTNITAQGRMLIVWVILFMIHVTFIYYAFKQRESEKEKLNQTEDEILETFNKTNVKSESDRRNIAAKWGHFENKDKENELIDNDNEDIILYGEKDPRRKGAAEKFAKMH